MDEYLNDTYKIIPSMQKTIIYQKDKIKSFDDYISKFSEKMNKLNKASEDFEKRITEINSKTQDLNMAELLKANMGEIEGEEG